MMKILSLLILVFSFSVQGKTKCSFTRHHYVEVEGKALSKELRNKILNEFNPDQEIVQKVNEDLAVKICATFRPLHNIKDIPLTAAPKQEKLLTKVTLSPNKNGFWEMSIENFVRKDEKELTAITTAATYTAAKSIKDIKNSEVAEWVSSKLLILNAQ